MKIKVREAGPKEYILKWDNGEKDTFTAASDAEAKAKAVEVAKEKNHLMGRGGVQLLCNGKVIAKGSVPAANGKYSTSYWSRDFKGFESRVKESGYTDASKVHSALEDGNYFTSGELELVTSGWGLNTDTLDRICQVRYGMDADQLLVEGASEKKQEDAPWQPTMKKIRGLKKDEYFTLRPVEEPKESQVWVMDGYDRGERKWYAYKFADVNDGRYFSGDKEVCTGFTF